MERAVHGADAAPFFKQLTRIPVTPALLKDPSPTLLQGRPIQTTPSVFMLTGDVEKALSPLGAGLNHEGRFAPACY